MVGHREREKGQDRDVMRERQECCGEREREMRNKENEERERGSTLNTRIIKKIISFYNCATIPSQICDGTVVQL